MGGGGKMFPDGMFAGLDEHAADGRALADLFVQAPLPPLPDRLTPKVLREAIASVLAGVSANELAQECVRFGLSPEEEAKTARGTGSGAMSSGGSSTGCCLS